MQRRLSRRDILKLFGSASVGTVLAPLVTRVAGAGAARSQFEGAKVVVMYSSSEFTEAHRAAILEKFGIEIEFLEVDGERFKAMEAAGTPPDLFQAGGRDLGEHVVQKRVMPLNDFVDASSVLTWDDFNGCIRQHMFDGIQVGSGNLYGIPKDWSPDYTLWINTAAFEEAGLTVPSEETPMTWQQVFELAPQMVKTEGDRTLRWGFDNHYWNNGLPQPSFLLEMLAQVDGAPELYGETFESINLVDNPTVMEIMRTAFGLAQEHVIPTTLDPLGTWFGQGFTQGQSAILNTGYWFGGMAESDITKGSVLYLPAPLYGSPEKRRSSSLWAQGISIHAGSQNPEAAWQVIEYFCGMEPAEERARAGWGLPLLKSMMNLVPQDTEFNQQRFKVVSSELDYVTDPLKFNPYEPEFVDENAAWEKALAGEMTLEEAVQRIQDDTNAVIQEQLARLS